MLDLSLLQIFALGFGAALVAVGLAGLLPAALRWYRGLNAGVRALEPALASADAFIRPWMPRPLPASRKTAKAEDQAVVEQAQQAVGNTVDEVEMDVRELTAQLFEIRMTLGDLTAEVEAMRAVQDEQAPAEAPTLPEADLLEAA